MKMSCIEAEINKLIREKTVIENKINKLQQKKLFKREKHKKMFDNLIMYKLNTLLNMQLNVQSINRVHFQMCSSFYHVLYIYTENDKFYFELSNIDNLKVKPSGFIQTPQYYDEALRKYPQFKKYENLIEQRRLMAYVYKMYNLYVNTDYLDDLPLATTFLLCNSKTRIFPKDIANIITNKILFFFIIFLFTKFKFIKKNILFFYYFFVYDFVFYDFVFYDFLLTKFEFS
jgi:hypothetical protein